eukprot:6481669-Amphidinium_carterae.1
MEPCNFVQLLTADLTHRHGKLSHWSAALTAVRVDVSHSLSHALCIGDTWVFTACCGQLFSYMAM